MASEAGTHDVQGSIVSVPPAPSFLGTSLGSGRFGGGFQDYAFWNAVQELYEKENLKGAYELALHLGTGGLGSGLRTFRLVQAEHLLEDRGDLIEPSKQLSVQYLPAEVEDIDRYVILALHIMVGETHRFGWKKDDKVRLTLLAEESDAMWATNRFGYCVQKEPFYKICIPFHALADERRFATVFSHEFAHVISLSESKSRVPKWVGEGFSVYASYDLSGRARDQLVHADAWLDPKNLELQFGPGTELDSSEKWLAYQQSGFIVNYLGRNFGDQKLIEFLESFADESFWLSMQVLITNQSRAEHGFRRVYGMSQREVFEKARLELRRG